MTLATFDFPYHRAAIDTVIGDIKQVQFGGGYAYRARTAVPQRKTFQLIFPVMRWYMDVNGDYDPNTGGTPGTPEYDLNLGRLMDFWDTHLTVDPFYYTPPIRSSAPLTVRFSSKLQIPDGDEGDDGTRRNIRLDLEELL